MSSMNPSTNELVTFLAAKNVFDGILFEPRLKVQLFDFTSTDQVRPLASDDAVFLNAEQYPIRITHLVAAVKDYGTLLPGGASSDPRLVQRIGLRIRAHDTYYMNDQYVNLPLWATERVAAPDVVTRALSTWRLAFGKHRRNASGGLAGRSGTFMGDRDSFEVKLALEYPVDAETEVELTVDVTFHGVGAISRRPKHLTGSYTFDESDGTASRQIPIEAFRNDGTEPLEITNVTVSVQAPTGTAGSDPTGNIRRVRMSIRQIGNGTNQRWTTTSAESAQLVPASLWGLSTGRAVVHELPKNDDDYPGWLWDPNQGLTLEVLPNAASVRCGVYIGLAGHIVVK